MPVAPYPISGVVYDDNGTGSTNLVDGATVIVRNVTKNEFEAVATNSAGEFLVDLANFTTDYSNSDRIQITAFFGAGSNEIVLDRRHTIDTAVGFYNAGNMILHPLGDHFFGNYTPTTYVSKKALLSYSIANRTASAVQVHLYDRLNDRLVMAIVVPATTTINSQIGSYIGKEFDGGICVIYSDEGTTSITYTGDAAASALPSVVATLVTK